VRVRTLSGLGELAAGSDELIRLIDSIPLVSTAKATSIVRDFERAVADAAEKRVRSKVVPEVESAVKKGIMISVGASALIGLIVLRRSRR